MTHPIPTPAPAGFHEWLKYIEQEAHKPNPELGACDMITPFSFTGLQPAPPKPDLAPNGLFK